MSADKWIASMEWIGGFDTARCVVSAAAMLSLTTILILKNHLQDRRE